MLVVAADGSMLLTREEAARRRAAREAGDIDSIEGELRGFGEESLAVTVEALSPESTTAKPCPKCFASTLVKTQNHVRVASATPPGALQRRPASAAPGFLASGAGFGASGVVAPTVK